MGGGLLSASTPGRALLNGIDRRLEFGGCLRIDVIPREYLRLAVLCIVMICGASQCELNAI
ncbi:unnamed protein product [Tuber melanosporum]|uniref:(Perigord truffle) hypothetical protein n=1 Tax=Tuber melanosporum (strain Mel28) TaxID=656061 RepID=D5G4Y5_TUBMM|nr:uncharacterized protein GSTUM_00000155001 [Tuber melanosporum]CAZ79578.1 unnamed protein product [Tuber melanosporum]